MSHLTPTKQSPNPGLVVAHDTVFVFNWTPPWKSVHDREKEKENDKVFSFCQGGESATFIKIDSEKSLAILLEKEKGGGGEHGHHGLTVHSKNDMRG